MGYYLQIDLDEMEPLASNTGWGDVIRWSETLPPADASALHHFCDFGWEEDVDALKTQLTQTLKTSPPADHQTITTLENWLSLLNAHTGKITVVSVTDGTG